MWETKLLAVKVALEDWRHWFEGSEQPFLVWTDHKYLEHIWTAKRLNPRQSRWALFFNRVNFTLSYCPGSKNIKHNALPPQIDWNSSCCVVGAVTRGTEERVKRANAHTPAPDDCPLNRLFIPVPLHWAHSSLFSCHPRIRRTSLLPFLELEVGEYVAACPGCARGKTPQQSPPSPRTSIL